MTTKQETELLLKDDDWDAIRDIMDRHLVENGGEPLGLVEVHLDKKAGSVDLKTSAWVIEVTDYLRNRYGMAEALDGMRIVLGTCMRRNETLH